jgi:hypothetical protein
MKQHIEELEVQTNKVPKAILSINDLENKLHKLTEENEARSKGFETKVESLENHVTTFTTEIITSKNISAIKQLPDTLMMFDARISSLEGTGLEEQPEEVPE